MKTAFITLLLMAATLNCMAKPKLADYSVIVHVQSSHLVAACQPNMVTVFCRYTLYLNVVIDTKKYELQSTDWQTDQEMLHLGDYNAKAVDKPVDDPSDNIKPRTYAFRRNYEFLFADSRTRTFHVVGESE